MNIRNQLAFGGFVGVQFESDLQTLHKTRSGNSIAESLASLPATILPACAKFNGTSHFLYNASGPYLQGGTAFDKTVKFNAASKSGSVRTLWSYGGYAAASKGISCYIALTTGVITVTTASGTALSTATFHAITLNTDYELRVQWDGQTGGTITATLNGIAMTSNISTAWVGNSGFSLSVGCYRPSSPVSFFSGKIYEFDTYKFNGLGKYEYDLTGVNNLTWNGNAPHTDYSSYASGYFLTNGYSVYKKTGELDEYVPTGVSATFLTLLGYLLSDHDTYAGSVSDVNMFPCYIDFNPTDGVDARIAIFDRSNVTRCTDLARGSLYISTEPYRWHISEIADPRVYFEYFNIGYAGLISAKIETQLSGGVYYIKKFSEQLNYATDKTGVDQYKVMQYCKSNVFAV